MVSRLWEDFNLVHKKGQAHGVIINFEDLAELISGEIREGASRPLSIKADKEVTHGKVIQVMDMARQKGVQLVTIATQKRMSEK